MPDFKFVVSDPALEGLARELQTLLGAVHTAAELILEAASPRPPEKETEVLAVLRRADPRDALLVSDQHVARRAAQVLDDPAALDPADPFRAVGEGARIGAVGLLRVAQLGATRPDLAVERFKNEHDLVAAFDANQFPAALVSCATLDRLGRSEGVRRRLEPPWIGETAAGVVWIRGPWQPDLRERLLPLEDRSSRIEVVAELAVAEAFVAPEGCLVGVQARVSHSRLDVRALVVNPSTGRAIAAKRTGEATMRGAHRVAAMLTRTLEERGAGGLRHRRDG